MSGLDQHPATTIADRAFDLLGHGALTSAELGRDVLGLVGAPPAVVERLIAALLAPDPRVQRLLDGRWGVAAQIGTSPRLEDIAFAVVDVETTGTRSRGEDRVLEVGVVLVQGQRREVVFDRLVNPGRPVPAPVVRLTRIPPDDVRVAPAFEEIADDLLAVLAGRVFVAHNVRFDWGFLDSELRRTRGVALHGPRLCTARLARGLVPEAESCGLDWLTEYFGLSNPARHRAAGDAWATAQLLGLLLDRARGRDARTLLELEGLQHRRQRRKKSRRR